MPKVSSTNILKGKNTEGKYIDIQVSSEGRLALDVSKTAFGELITAEYNPYIDLRAFKGLPERVVETYTSGTGSFAGMTESADDFAGKVHSQIASASGIGTTLTNIIMFKKITFSNNVLNISDIRTLQASVATEGNFPAIVEIRLNPTVTGVIKYNYTDEDVPMTYDISNNTISGGELIYSASLGKSSNIMINLSVFDLILSNDDVLSIAVRATSGTVSPVASLTWGDI